MGKRKTWISLIFMTMLVSAGIFKYAPDIVTVSNNVNGRELPVYSVQTDKKQVALTFDSAWGDEYTQDLLDILASHNLRVTFFMTGGWAEKYPEDVKKIQAAGHDIGNHSQNHKNMSQLNAAEQKEEIMKVHETVKDLTGIEMKLFRPPYGDYNDTLIKTAESCGYQTIQWSVDSLDWKDYGADNIVDTILNNKNLENGAIILCHNGAKYMKDALDRVITGLQEKGYEIVPVSELVYQEPYHMDVNGRQIQD